MNGNPDSLPVALPDGTQFQPWRDETDYRWEYCVDQQHPQTSDQNPGTEAAPFLTIPRAAELVAPNIGVSPAESAALRHALVE